MNASARHHLHAIATHDQPAWASAAREAQRRHQKVEAVVLLVAIAVALLLGVWMGLG